MTSGAIFLLLGLLALWAQLPPASGGGAVGAAQSRSALGSAQSYAPATVPVLKEKSAAVTGVATSAPECLEGLP
ncbi:unnamed protein product, partial [Natator depressus]